MMTDFGRRVRKRRRRGEGGMRVEEGRVSRNGGGGAFFDGMSTRRTVFNCLHASRSQQNWQLQSKWAPQRRASHRTISEDYVGFYSHAEHLMRRHLWHHYKSLSQYPVLDMG